MGISCSLGLSSCVYSKKKKSKNACSRLYQHTFHDGSLITLIKNLLMALLK